jgi:hypothetical protein
MAPMYDDLRLVASVGVMRSFGAALALLLSACAPGSLRGAPPASPIAPPYPYSRLLPVSWDFSTLYSQRKAHGSDLWPCAWAADEDLYCAWGDGGGFDGDDDQIGRVSLGFARIEGLPARDNPGAIRGRNIWGLPPYAETEATFGGKVGSLVALNGVLYASGGFWTTANVNNPAHKSGRGPLSSLAWSTDAARTWQIAPWSSSSPLGSFIDRGQDSMNEHPDYLYLYYLRERDDQHVFLERLRPSLLTADPNSTGKFEYFAGTSWLFHQPRWSTEEKRAIAVFADRNHVEGPSAVYDAPLHRYLLTTGHYASGNDDDSSAGQVGLFAAPTPWGPWSTLGYYENWGNLRQETTGDFLSLRIPSKWISKDGKTVWAVFSGLKSFDSFNLVRGTLGRD